METGYGEPLPPEPLAGTGVIPARLDLAPAEMKVAGAGGMEMPGRRPGAPPASARTPPGRRWRLGASHRPGSPEGGRRSGKGRREGGRSAR